MNLLKLRKAIRAKRIEWNKHSLERMLERGISRSMVFEVLLTGEEIENYPDDKPYPSALIFGKIEKTPLHMWLQLLMKLTTFVTLLLHTILTKNILKRTLKQENELASYSMWLLKNKLFTHENT